MVNPLVMRRAPTVGALALVAAVAGAGALPGRASAATAASSCAATDSLSQPFAPWGDASEYRLAPGGAFSSGATNWSLSGGASIVGGGDGFNLAGVASPASLSLPAGASAQSPFSCVDSSQPTIRFVDAGATSTLQVQVVYATPWSGTIAATAAVLSPGASWNATPIIQDGAGLAGAIQGGTAQMAVRITAQGGPAQVDDVYVDPIWHGG